MDVNYHFKARERGSLVKLSESNTIECLVHGTMELGEYRCLRKFGLLVNFLRFDGDLINIEAFYSLHA